jgi:hypothetical protein
MENPKPSSDELVLSNRDVSSHGSINPFTKESNKSSNKLEPIRKRINSPIKPPAKDHNFDKVIIPYNFEKKRYWINKKDVDIDGKEYILNKLEELCKNEAFNIESKYNLKNREKVYFYLPTIILSIIGLYLYILLLVLFSFNPLLIYLLYSFSVKGFHSIQMFKFTIVEKLKKKEINKIINEENDSTKCQSRKLKWVLGQSGYWIEIHKLV